MEKKKYKNSLLKYSLILKVNVLLLFKHLATMDNNGIFTFII